MQLTEALVPLATDMFKHIWEARRLQAANVIAAGQKKIDEIEQQIGKAIDQMMSLTNDAVINRFEQRITDLEKQKVLLVEKQAQKPEPKGALEEKLELALRFLSGPCKLWESEQIAVRRLVLKLAFADRLYYCRNQGARTLDFAFPFKALAALEAADFANGAAGED